MIIRPARPLIRTAIDLPVNRADRGIPNSLFLGWGVDLPGNRVL